MSCGGGAMGELYGWGGVGKDWNMGVACVQFGELGVVRSLFILGSGQWSERCGV